MTDSCFVSETVARAACHWIWMRASSADSCALMWWKLQNHRLNKWKMPPGASFKNLFLLSPYSPVSVSRALGEAERGWGEQELSGCPVPLRPSRPGAASPEDGGRCLRPPAGGARASRGGLCPGLRRAGPGPPLAACFLGGSCFGAVFFPREGSFRGAAALFDALGNCSRVAPWLHLFV